MSRRHLNLDLEPQPEAPQKPSVRRRLPPLESKFNTNPSYLEMVRANQKELDLKLEEDRLKSIFRGSCPDCQSRLLLHEGYHFERYRVLCLDCRSRFRVYEGTVSYL